MASYQRQTSVSRIETVVCLWYEAITNIAITFWRLRIIKLFYILYIGIFFITLYINIEIYFTSNAQPSQVYCINYLLTEPNLNINFDFEVGSINSSDFFTNKVHYLVSIFKNGGYIIFKVISCLQCTCNPCEIVRSKWHCKRLHFWSLFARLKKLNNIFWVGWLCLFKMTVSELFWEFQQKMLCITH